MARTATLIFNRPARLELQPRLRYRKALLTLAILQLFVLGALACLQSIRHWLRPARMANRRGLRYHPRQRKGWSKMDLLRYPHVPPILLLVALAGCTQPQNSQELEEKTAQATAEVKRDAKAVAEGIREGWSRDKPLDLNTATKAQLESLPGMTAAEAD